MINNIRVVDNQAWQPSETDSTNSIEECRMKLLHKHLQLLHQAPKLRDSAKLSHQLLTQYASAANDSHLLNHQLHHHMDQMTNLRGDGDGF